MAKHSICPLLAQRKSKAEPEPTVSVQVFLSLLAAFGSGLDAPQGYKYKPRPQHRVTHNRERKCVAKVAIR